MKRKREIRIVLDAFERAGIQETKEIYDAIAEGLKNIRKEKFAEKQMLRKERKRPKEKPQTGRGGGEK